MRVKRYVVDTMPDAMRSIRTDLGTDAVILSTKEIKVGGFLGMFKKTKIEVVAAVEKEQKTAPPAKPLAPVQNIPRSAVPQAYQKAAASAQPAPAPSTASEVGVKPPDKRSYAEIAAALSEAVGLTAPDALGQPSSIETLKDEADEYIRPPVPEKERQQPVRLPIQENSKKEDKAATSVPDSDVLREIKEMKQWMERIARQSSDTMEMPEPLEQLKSRLLEQETDAVLVEEWVHAIHQQWEDEGRTWGPEQFEESLLEELNVFLADRIGGGIEPDTKIVYIAGPTGVGKTTTIAKLAAEQLFRQGRKVGLITSDTYRISAVEQLRTYASILNIPIEVVQSPGDFQRAMFRLESCDLILMDTAGRNYRNEMLVAELQSLLGKDLKSETYLVLSLTSKSRDMKRIAENFGRYHLDKVIFTKLDETGSYGPLFNVLNDFPMTLSYLTNGQNVPDDLLMASTERLQELLLGSGGY